MDAYEATKIVFSRIQNVDPENAAKIMGLLLIQDHGEKDMIRMAFGPETLLQSVVLKARNDLGLLSPPSPSLFSSISTTPRSPSSSSSSSSSSRSPVFSRSCSNRNANDCPDDILAPNAASNMDFQLQEPLGNHSKLLPVVSSATDLSGEEGECPFYPEMMGSEFPPPPPPNGSGLSWGPNGGLCSPPGLGWKQCLYYARGYCKNGNACRFLHGPTEDASPVADVVGGEQQQQLQLLMRSQSQRLSGSQLMASAASFVPSSPTNTKCLSLLLKQQQQLQLQENQRAAAAAPTAMMLIADEQLKYLSRARMERSDYLGMANPGSRQIYLTFPADSTFREEDVSNYFSIYGPVQDVRIPYQQKRMFGFVTFVYPETVKLILAKGNPHFVCNSRVLVKPYKEKGKVFEKKLQQQQLLMERCDFSRCSSPTGFDCRDHYDLQQLGARMLFSNKELLMRRKVEEQQTAIDLQQAIELQRRRFTGLQMLDLKLHNVSTAPVTAVTTSTDISSISPEEQVVLEGNASGGTAAAAVSPSKVRSDFNHQNAQEVQGEVVNSSPAASDKDKDSAARQGKPSEDSHYQESIEHNLPDSPFASPTELSCVDNSFSSTVADVMDIMVSPLHNSGSRLTASTIMVAPSPVDIASSFESCFLPVPRFSSHRAVGM